MEFSGDLIDDLILLKIYSYLPYNSLTQCMIVSKKWNNLVKHTLKTRTESVKTILFDYQIKKTDKYSHDLIDTPRFDSIINEQLNHVYTRPDKCVCFLTEAMFDLLMSKIAEDESSKETDDASQARSRSKRFKKSITSFERLQTLLAPMNSSYIYIFSHGVIGTDVKKRKTLEVNSCCQRLEFDIGISGLLFSKSNEYSIKTYLCTNKNKNKIDLNEKNDLFKLFNQPETDSHKLKLLVILISVNNKNEVKKLLKFLNKHYQNEIAITGALVETIHVNNVQKHQGEHISYMCLAYFGTGSFNVKQVNVPLIDDDDIEEHNDYEMSQKNELKNKLEKLKANLTGKPLFALHIKCFSRNAAIFGVEMYECTEFRKQFPNIPLCGVTGYGEIGNMHLDNFKNTDELALVGFTSVFTIVSIN